MAKRVWRRERDLTGWMSLSRKPEETWYGWDGDRLTTVQTDTTRIQTVYQPSFAPLIRIETDNGEREKAQCRSLAEKIAAGRERGRARRGISGLNWWGCWTGWRGNPGKLREQ